MISLLEWCDSSPAVHALPEEAKETALGALASIGLKFATDQLFITEQQLLRQPLLRPPPAQYAAQSSTPRAAQRAPSQRLLPWYNFIEVTSAVVARADETRMFLMPRELCFSKVFALQVTKWTKSCPRLTLKKVAEAVLFQHVYQPLAALSEVVDGTNCHAYIIGEPHGSHCDAYVHDGVSGAALTQVVVKTPASLCLSDVRDPLLLWNNSQHLSFTSQPDPPANSPRGQLQSGLCQLYGHLVDGRSLWGVLCNYESHIFCSRLEPGECLELLHHLRKHDTQDAPTATHLHACVAAALAQDGMLWVSHVVQHAHPAPGTSDPTVMTGFRTLGLLAAAQLAGAHVASGGSCPYDQEVLQRGEQVFKQGDIEFQGRKLADGVSACMFFGQRVAVKYWDAYKSPEAADEMLHEVKSLTHEDSQAALAALQKIHDCAVLHGDVHVSNFCIDQDTNQAFWLDFGRAVFCPGMDRNHPDAIREQMELRAWLGLPPA
ncbi:hypothetical protein WJX73_010882 [Symbiochloris irregularis]|uniref:Protein kinase domain-containing protein n=1 Tax=Symbiochloris irregularis TaxID=706552 RepID=A0AAW1NNW8_9CHLO